MGWCISMHWSVYHANQSVGEQKIQTERVGFPKDHQFALAARMSRNQCIVSIVMYTPITHIHNVYIYIHT